MKTEPRHDRRVIVFVSLAVAVTGIAESRASSAEHLLVPRIVWLASLYSWVALLFARELARRVLAQRADIRALISYAALKLILLLIMFFPVRSGGAPGACAFLVTIVLWLSLGTLVAIRIERAAEAGRSARG